LYWKKKKGLNNDPCFCLRALGKKRARKAKKVEGRK
jgi:hypothetical protein